MPLYSQNGALLVDDPWGATALRGCCCATVSGSLARVAITWLVPPGDCRCDQVSAPATGSHWSGPGWQAVGQAVADACTVTCDNGTSWSGPFEFWQMRYQGGAWRVSFYVPGCDGTPRAWALTISIVPDP